MVEQDILLPERHPQLDFFIADIFDSIPFKNDRHTMEHPFFTLSMKKDVRAIEYEYGNVNISLSPSAKHGLPTMMDKDILLYCGSLVVAEMNKHKGKYPPKTMRFSAHDLMVATNRESNGKGYQLLRKAFERLAGCLITTNIETDGKRVSAGFHLIESYRVIEKSRINDRMVRVEVTLSNWFYDALIGREVLTINRDYFRLRKTLERRLYEIARKHCGKQTSWKIGLDKLHQKSGSQSPLYKFRYQIRQIIENDILHGHFPDYRLAMEGNDTVRFSPKSQIQEQPAQASLAFDLDTLPRITPQTIDKGRIIVQDSGTGLDFYAIQAEFTESLTKGFKPDKVNGAFIAFIHHKIKQSA